MAYSTSNPPMVYVPGIGNLPTLWVYKHTDTDDTVIAAGYVTDAASLGMKLNDIVLIVDSTTPKVSLASVSAINATTGASTMVFGAVS